MKFRYTHFFSITLTIILIISCRDNQQRHTNNSEIQVKELNKFDNYLASEDLLLGMPVRLKYDDVSQHLLIQDLPNWGITEIDDSSNVIHQYGRRGRGPGEIQMLNDFFFNNEHLYIVDGGQFFIHKYNRENGKHISSLNYGEIKRRNLSDGASASIPIPLNDNNNQPFVTLNETVLIPSHFGEEYLYKAVNWEGEKVADIGEMPENCKMNESEEKVRSALENKQVPAKDHCFAFPVNDRANPDEIFIIYSAIPKIEKYNLSGRKLWERNIPFTPEVDSLAMDLSKVAKEHSNRRLDAMKVRKYIAGRSSLDGKLFLMTYTNLVTRYAPRRSLWLHLFDESGNLTDRIRIISEDDLNPYIGIDFFNGRIIVSPHMQVDIREYYF